MGVPVLPLTEMSQHPGTCTTPYWSELVILDPFLSCLNLDQLADIFNLELISKVIPVGGPGIVGLEDSGASLEPGL